MIRVPMNLMKAVSCWALIALATTALAQDRVFVKQGTPAQGTISEITPIKVTIDVRGKPQTYPIKEVRKITFDKEPIQLDRARDLVIEGKHQQAIDELRAVQRSSLEGYIQQDFDFYLSYSEGAQSLAGSGDPRAAIRGLMALDKANPNSHHRFEIKEMLGRLALAMASFDNAKAFFESLDQSPDLAQKANGVYLQGNVLFMQNKYAEAKTLLAAPQALEHSAA